MIKDIFEPKSIVVIGASNDLKKWGGGIVYNLIHSGYNGEILTVNPKEYIIQGMPCFKSIKDIDGDSIDMAIIVVPANKFISVLKECGEMGVKGIVGITAGFKEIGNVELENEVISILKQYNMRMLGPNCLGFMNLEKHINASIIEQTPKFGGISFIAQSGTMGIAIVENAVLNGVGLNKIISVGNKADIDDIDILEYLEQDESTKVIVIYAESINRGKDFIRIAKKIKKPIIILKAGRSKKGAKAAFSHTGSMAGSDEVYSVAFKQAGIIRVDQMEELFDAAIVFSQNLPRGPRVGIIANGGGAGILAADLCEKYGIELPDLEQKTIDKIKKISKEYASIKNPIDTAADSTYDIYYKTTDAILEDENIDAVIVIYVHTQLVNSIPPATAIIDAYGESYWNKNYKPVIACFFGGPGYEKGAKLLEEFGIPNYTTPERAIRALNYLLQQKIYLSRKQ